MHHLFNIFPINFWAFSCDLWILWHAPSYSLPFCWRFSIKNFPPGPLNFSPWRSSRVAQPKPWVKAPSICPDSWSAYEGPVDVQTGNGGVTRIRYRKTGGVFKGRGERCFAHLAISEGREGQGTWTSAFAPQGKEYLDRTLKLMICKWCFAGLNTSIEDIVHFWTLTSGIETSKMKPLANDQGKRIPTHASC